MTAKYFKKGFSFPCCFLLIAVCSISLFPGIASAASGDKPNIVIIWGDDIGQSNISAYTRGVMGYRTPNIDRIAKEGIIFTDYYGEQSCTAGRSSFILGQSVFRTADAGAEGHGLRIICLPLRCRSGQRLEPDRYSHANILRREFIYQSDGL